MLFLLSFDFFNSKEYVQIFGRQGLTVVDLCLSINMQSFCELTKNKS
jgi:hypothetical protein